MKTARFIVLAILLASLLAACAGPVSVPPTPDVNAIVAQTLQALTAGPNAGITPLAPTATPSLLPRSLYFLNADAAGHAQVFRLAADGRTRGSKNMRWGP